MTKMATITYVWQNEPDSPITTTEVTHESNDLFYAKVVGSVSGICLGGGAVTSLTISEV